MLTIYRIRSFANHSLETTSEAYGHLHDPSSQTELPIFSRLILLITSHPCQVISNSIFVSSIPTSNLCGIPFSHVHDTCSSNLALLYLFAAIRYKLINYALYSFYWPLFSFLQVCVQILVATAVLTNTPSVSFQCTYIDKMTNWMSTWWVEWRIGRGDVSFSFGLNCLKYNLIIILKRKRRITQNKI